MRLQLAWIVGVTAVAVKAQFAIGDLNDGWKCSNPSLCRNGVLPWFSNKGEHIRVSSFATLSRVLSSSLEEGEEYALSFFASTGGKEKVETLVQFGDWAGKVDVHGNGGFEEYTIYTRTKGQPELRLTPLCNEGSLLLSSVSIVPSHQYRKRQDDGPPPSDSPTTTRNDGPPPSDTPTTTQNDGPPPSDSPTTTRNDGPPPSDSPTTTRNDGPPPSDSPTTTSNDGPPPSDSPTTTSNDGPPPSDSPTTTTNGPPPSDSPTTTTTTTSPPSDSPTTTTTTTGTPNTGNPNDGTTTTTTTTSLTPNTGNPNESTTTTTTTTSTPNTGNPNDSTTTTTTTTSTPNTGNPGGTATASTGTATSASGQPTVITPSNPAPPPTSPSTSNGAVPTTPSVVVPIPVPSSSSASQATPTFPTSVGPIPTVTPIGNLTECAPRIISNGGLGASNTSYAPFTCTNTDSCQLLNAQDTEAGSNYLSVGNFSTVNYQTAAVAGTNYSITFEAYVSGISAVDVLVQFGSFHQTISVPNSLTVGGFNNITFYAVASGNDDFAITPLDSATLSFRNLNIYRAAAVCTCYPNLLTDGGFTLSSTSIAPWTCANATGTDFPQCGVDSDRPLAPDGDGNWGTLFNHTTLSQATPAEAGTNYTITFSAFALTDSPISTVVTFGSLNETFLVASGSDENGPFVRYNFTATAAGNDVFSISPLSAFTLRIDDIVISDPTINCTSGIGTAAIVESTPSTNNTDGSRTDNSDSSVIHTVDKASIFTVMIALAFGITML
ncbi:hypothetical protein BT69DRAFT_1351300 [Atractiella rhizophila]|nr:hypothetical protein BT69DRAFT_1351300 [Atractiella rhizophila]